MHFNRFKARRLREEQNLTLQALADIAEVNIWSVGAWERGKFKPNGRSLVALARALGVEPEELLTDEQATAAPKGDRSRGGTHARGSAAVGLSNADL